MTRCLGIDYGAKRVGLAISDALGMTARPLEVVPSGDVRERISEIVAELNISRLVVGIPTGLDGREGSSAERARRLGEELAGVTGLPISYVDERFTSKIAEERLIGSGLSRRERRDKVDAEAAAIILQDFLDREARLGNEEDI